MCGGKACARTGLLHTAALHIVERRTAALLARGRGEPAPATAPTAVPTRRWARLSAIASVGGGGGSAGGSTPECSSSARGWRCGAQRRCIQPPTAHLPSSRRSRGRRGAARACSRPHGGLGEPASALVCVDHCPADAAGGTRGEATVGGSLVFACLPRCSAAAIRCPAVARERAAHCHPGAALRSATRAAGAPRALCPLLVSVADCN